MNIYAISSLAGFILNTAIGSFVYLRNKEKEINKLFGLFCLTIDFWLFGCFTQSLLLGKEWSLLFDKILYTGVALCPAVYLHFVITMVDLKNKNRLINIAYYISSVFLAINYIPFLRTFMVSDVVQKYSFRFIALPNILWFLLVLDFIIYALYEFIIIYFAIIKNKGHKQTQLKYLFAATIIINIAGSMYFLLLLNIPTPPIDNLLVVVYGSVMAYAIVRHQLMEIEVIIRRAVVFAGLFAAVYGVFAFFTFLTQAVFQNITGGNRWAAFIPTMLVITLALRPLENYLIRITDKFLFQKRYDYRELLRMLAREVITIMDLDKLAKRIVENLVDIMRLEKCAILVFDKNKDTYNIIASKGLKDVTMSFAMDNPMILTLKATHVPITKSEHIKAMSDRDPIKEDMKKLEAEFILPLIVHDELIGIISLGMKKSGEDYNQDDIAVLESLAGTSAVAISNAQYIVNTMQLEAEAAQREKMAVIGTLAAGINHEICNPLGIARGQCEVYLLNQKEGLYKDKPKDEQITEAMNIMEKVVHEADRATAITKKLSSFAKPSKGEISDDVKIAGEVNEVMALVGHELRLEKVDVKIDISSELPYISVDRKQIQQILFNIIRNAGQAIGEKGAITITAKVKGDKVKIDIEDTGPGIPKDRLSEIFNPFYTTKEPGKGTGLGLFIVRQLVERNKGKIQVESQVGKGTKFALEFPVAKSYKELYG